MNEHDSEQERRIAERARQLFAQNVAGLDGQTRSRLARARAAAVEAHANGPGWFPVTRLVPLGGVAAAVLAVAAFLGDFGQPAAPVETAALNDLELLLDGEELELFEDLEFYAWLLEQPEILE